MYARDSTTDQNCEMQLAELREQIARRNFQPASTSIPAGVAP